MIRYETKDIISLPNANYIYGVTKNDKLIKIQNKSYENINIIKNNEKIISITCFGNDDIAMEKYQVSDLTAKANLCTYAGCIGNVLYGYGNIYWNSEGNIPFDYNGTDIYNQNNIITFGVHEVGDNSVPQFIDIGYASVKGRINDISECPYIPALTEQGISEYQTWIDNMGCFIPKKDSILRAPINLFNQKDVFGASITVDLNGNPRTDLTIIGCYDFIE